MAVRKTIGRKGKNNLKTNKSVKVEIPKPKKDSVKSTKKKNSNDDNIDTGLKTDPKVISEIEDKESNVKTNKTKTRSRPKSSEKQKSTKLTKKTTAKQVETDNKLKIDKIIEQKTGKVTSKKQKKDLPVVEEPIAQKNKQKMIINAAKKDIIETKDIKKTPIRGKKIVEKKKKMPTKSIKRFKNDADEAPKKQEKSSIKSEQEPVDLPEKKSDQPLPSKQKALKKAKQDPIVPVKKKVKQLISSKQKTSKKEPILPVVEKIEEPDIPKEKISKKSIKQPIIQAEEEPQQPSVSKNKTAKKIEKEPVALIEKKPDQPLVLKEESAQKVQNEESKKEKKLNVKSKKNQVANVDEKSSKNSKSDFQTLPAATKKYTQKTQKNPKSQKKKAKTNKNEPPQDVNTEQIQNIQFDNIVQDASAQINKSIKPGKKVQQKEKSEEKPKSIFDMALQKQEQSFSEFLRQNHQNEVTHETFSPTSQLKNLIFSKKAKLYSFQYDDQNSETEKECRWSDNITVMLYFCTDPRRLIVVRTGIKHVMIDSIINYDTKSLQNKDRVTFTIIMRENGNLKHNLYAVRFTEQNDAQTFFDLIKKQEN